MGYILTRADGSTDGMGDRVIFTEEHYAREAAEELGWDWAVVRDITSESAERIARALATICTEERLREYAADEYGHDELLQYESLVRIRLGADYDDSAWDAAMDIIRERHRT